MAIAACLETVMAALPRSFLSPPDQLFRVIDRLRAMPSPRNASFSAGYRRDKSF